MGLSLENRFFKSVEDSRASGVSPGVQKSRQGLLQSLGDVQVWGGWRTYLAGVP